MIAEESMRRLYSAYDQGFIINNDEFMSDAARIVLTTRLLSKWVDNGTTPLRLLVNHITLIRNVFGEEGMYALYEYVANFPDCVPPLLTILHYMGLIGKPAFIEYDLMLELDRMDRTR